MRFVKKIAPTVVIIVIFGYLIWKLAKDWSRIPFQDLHMNIPLLVLSFIVLIPHFLFYSKSWQQIMAQLGSCISFSQSAWMIATTQIAKYAPGRIWYMLGRVYVGKQEKLSGPNLALSMVLETCLLLISSGILYFISTLLTGRFSAANIITCLALFVMAIVLMIPAVLGWMANLALKVLKKPAIKITVTFLQIVKLTPWFWGLWLSQIAGFYLLVNSFYTIPASSIFTLASAYTLSWITGFVVIFTPGGLGVREGVMTLALSTIMPPAIAIAMSLISRVWITFFEVAVFFIGLLVKKRSASDKKPGFLD